MNTIALQHEAVLSFRKEHNLLIFSTDLRLPIHSFTGFALPGGPYYLYHPEGHFSAERSEHSKPTKNQHT